MFVYSPAVELRAVLFALEDGELTQTEVPICGVQTKDGVRHTLLLFDAEVCRVRTLRNFLRGRSHTLLLVGLASQPDEWWEERARLAEVEIRAEVRPSFHVRGMQ